MIVCVYYFEVDDGMEGERMREEKERVCSGGGVLLRWEETLRKRGASRDHRKLLLLKQAVTRLVWPPTRPETPKSGQLFLCWTCRVDETFNWLFCRPSYLTVFVAPAYCFILYRFFHSLRFR
jgi:hypothetical protein